MVPLQNRRCDRDELDDLGASEAARKRKHLLGLLSSVIVIFIILIDSRQRNLSLFQRAISPDVGRIFSTSNDLEEFAAAVQTFKESL